MTSLEQLLQDNREQLIAQNMLEKGHGRSAAEGEIDGLLTLLSFVEDARLQLRSSDDQLTLTVGVDIRRMTDRASRCQNHCVPSIRIWAWQPYEAGC